MEILQTSCVPTAEALNIQLRLFTLLHTELVMWLQDQLEDNTVTLLPSFTFVLHNVSKGFSQPEAFAL